MPDQRLSYDDVEGVFAIMPTPATDNADQPDTEDSVDYEEARKGARKLVSDDVNAIMINGTFGESATLTESEWKQFTEVVVDAVDGAIPVIGGPTTLGTKQTIERAKFLRDVGADGMLLGRPMWCQLTDEGTAQFYRDVAEAVPELGIIVYYNQAAFKGEFSINLWHELADIPQVVGAKYGSFDVRFYDVFKELGDQIRLMPIEYEWFKAYRWFPEDAVACWSGTCASSDPYPVCLLRDALQKGDEETARQLTDKIWETTIPFHPEGNAVRRAGESDEFSNYTIQPATHHLDRRNAPERRSRFADGSR
ncbi:dihydrodipicolinate synthase family protein [Halostagnicola sp. A56]|uniref:dihydrodipicolinate synthase family protein n=1 Tax=Halostagnicola sp. A56 TaxID=1495067 RepID=UPI0009E21A46|nr:dihydrodipicolinate synthase family protein [Halostagnicola sp. A56]